MLEFKEYKRKGTILLRPYILGEDMSKFSVNVVDDPPSDMGMVAQNPQNPADQWYVARQYFDNNYEML